VLEKKKPDVLTKRKIAQEVGYLLDLPVQGPHGTFHGPAFQLVNTVIKVVVEALQRGESVFIPGFGTFKWKSYPLGTKYISYSYNGEPATKHSPRIIQPLHPKKRVIFKPSKVLKRMLNDDMS
jgi:nucleoid DNA-binding protein